MDDIEVAVKLFKINDTALVAYEEELACYEKMDATTGETCRIYGIPNIYFAGDARGTKVLVLPKFKYSLKWFITYNVQCSEEFWLNVMLELVCITYHDTAQSNSFKRICFVFRLPR